MRRALLAALALLLIGASWLAYRLNDRPSLEPYANLWLESTDAKAAGSYVSVTYFGVATLDRDGENLDHDRRLLHAASEGERDRRPHRPRSGCDRSARSRMPASATWRR
jgi:hypothetical protein